MGFFFSTNKYSTKPHQLSKQTIEALVSRTKVNSLDGVEESEVEGALDDRRGSDGKMSLQQIYDELTRLKNLNKKSKFLISNTKLLISANKNCNYYFTYNICKCETKYQ